jgi:hypothetical protein
MQHPDKHTYNIRPENIEETFVTDLCNIRVQPLQYMQYPNLFLQHPSETLSNILLKHLKHLEHTLVTCAFSKPGSQAGGAMHSGRGGEGGWQRASSYVALGEWLRCPWR